MENLLLLGVPILKHIRVYSGEATYLFYIFASLLNGVNILRKNLFLKE